MKTDLTGCYACRQRDIELYFESVTNRVAHDCMPQPASITRTVLTGLKHNEGPTKW